ncbi:MAG: hypothetical protein KAT05_12490 [Spirochaetes bacterium]|nr:hypothetical protein [Spirochaetota bacterium]
MQFINYKSLFICLFILLLNTPNILAQKNYYEDAEYLNNNTNIVDLINHTINEPKESSKIFYTIDLGRKEKWRPLIGEISSKSFINPIDDIALEIIEIHFFKTDPPNLVDLKIFFDVSDRYYSENIRIVAISGQGWEINNISNSGMAIITNVEYKKYLSDYINIYVVINNQSKFKERSFKIYNRDAVYFNTEIKLDKLYEFKSFNYQLPYKLGSQEEIQTYKDYFDIYSDSIIFSNKIINNELVFNSYLQGDDYLGLNSFGEGIPKKIIDFSYSYDYQENTNAKIVEENRKSTSLAIKLFTASLIISLISLFCSFDLDKFKEKLQKSSSFIIRGLMKMWVNRKSQK